MKKTSRAARRERAKNRKSTRPVTHANRMPANQQPPERDLQAAGASKGGEFVPYDENLLERARTQWQFGDWESLARLDRDALQHHPDRAKLALLAAAGLLQTYNTGAAREFLRLAQDWGCSKKLISQILIAGVHNSLGRAAALAGQQPRALKHFESAIAIGTPGSDLRLITQARINEQHTQLGLPLVQLTGKLGAVQSARPAATSTANIAPPRYASEAPTHQTATPPRRPNFP